MCFCWEKPTTKAKPAGRQHVSYTSPWMPRKESDDLRIFGLYPGLPSRVYLSGWIKYLTAKSSHLTRFHVIALSCLCGVRCAAGSVGLGTSTLAGLRWVVGENINGTANMLSRQLTPYATPIMHRPVRGGQRCDVELWRGVGK